MQTLSLTLLAATITTAVFSHHAQASIDVYTQSPVANSFVQSAILNASTDPGFNWTTDTDTEQWDYFSIGTDVSFNRIGWYGTQADGNFAVDLFSATCFSCGLTSVNGSGTFSHTISPQNSVTLLPNVGPFSQSQIHETQVSGNLYSYYIDLSSTLTLDHTQSYALSVVNNYSTLPFAWALSNVSGTHVQYNVGQAVVVPGPGTMAFTLTNTSASAVPVPASFWLLGSGLVYLLGIGRKYPTMFLTGFTRSKVV